MPASGTASRQLRSRKDPVIASTAGKNKAQPATPATKAKARAAPAQSTPAGSGKKRPADDAPADADAPAAKGGKGRKKKKNDTSDAQEVSTSAPQMSPEDYALFLKFKASQAKAKSASQLEAEKDAGEHILLCREVELHDCFKHHLQTFAGAI